MKKTETRESRQIKFSLAALFPVASWRQVLADRAAAGFTLGYAAHCIELFGSRAWMVAFLAYSAGLQAPGVEFPWNLAAIAAVVNLAAVPASILGNEVALRMGRGRWIQIAMVASGAAGIVLAFSAPAHWLVVLALLVVYSLFVMADSGTLTAGLVAAVPLRPARRGARPVFARRLRRRHARTVAVRRGARPRRRQGGRRGLDLGLRGDRRGLPRFSPHRSRLQAQPLS